MIINKIIKVGSECHVTITQCYSQAGDKHKAAVCRELHFSHKNT